MKKRGGRRVVDVMPTDAARDAAIARARSGTALTGKELRAILQIKPSIFFYHQARGDYDKLKVKASLGGLQVYSGALITKWLDGDMVFLPVFGRKRAT